MKENKSAQFRRMFDEGKKVAEIVKETGAPYPFVYSVIQKYQEFGAPAKDVGASKSEMFRTLFDQGATVAQIAKKTGSNYSFVYSVIQRYQADKEDANNGTSDAGTSATGK